jgi:hypothetical protein
MRFVWIAMLLVAPLVGCGGAPAEKSPEDIEKARQEHIQATQRELNESRGN